MVSIHSNNYLIEYCRQPGMPYWMKSLVYKVISNNGIPTEAEITEVVDDIKNGTNKSIAKPTVAPDNVDIRLWELTHHSGVNALAKKQTLKFGGEGICLVYGRNGSGKSGYFRILHEMAGGRIPHAILGNIHQPTTDPIDVNVKLEINGVLQTPKWTGGAFSVPEFKYISVFDSTYAESIIADRTEDSILLNNTTHSHIQAVSLTLDDIADRLKGDSHLKDVETQIAAFMPGTYMHSYFEALKDAFEDELGKFGITNLHVEIQEDNSNVAIPKLLVRLPHGNRPNEVLSEGEQKCVALAMFFAERDLLPHPYPMVFDDPLNSLDVRYMALFADRIIDMPNQVIVFTHHVLFRELLSGSNAVKEYSVDSPITDRPSTKRHLFKQTIVDYLLEKGVVTTEEENAAYYLKEANDGIRHFKSGPTETMQKLAIGLSLRTAIEWMIDEKVFMKIMPSHFKYGGYNSWKDMRRMSPTMVAVIDELEIQYGKLSSRATHVSGLSTIVPLELTELRNIYNKLIAL